MDALPVTEQTDVPFKSTVPAQFRGETVGVMHACGHDAYVAMLLGTAHILSKMRDRLAGQVLFVFQPAEEGAPDGERGGASLMLEDGLFDFARPDAIYGLHVMASLPTGVIGYRPGPLMAGSDSFAIEVRGRQTHGSRPWAGVDPIIASAQILTGLQTIVSRQLDITATPAVVTVGAIKGGIRFNIIPDQVEMIGTVRSFDRNVRADIVRRMESTVGSIAQASESEHGRLAVRAPKLLQLRDDLTHRRAGRDEVDDDLRGKLETISLGYYPAPTLSPPFVARQWIPQIPKIQQVVLEEYDRNAYNQPVARVDRCVSCHVAVDKKGFEDQPHPYRTHPNREKFFASHPPDKFGCTPCHNGDAPKVNGVVGAHANYYDEHGHLHEVHLREELALFRGPMMEANCLKCHPSAIGLEGAETAARGERLFVELGCHGCHLAEGYETLAKEDDKPVIGPSLRRIGDKVDPAWLVRWIQNPHEFRPRTRMPNFMFDETQATQIAAFLLASTKDSSAAWVAEHAAPASVQDAEAVARGKALVDTVGCRACHALSGMVCKK